MASYPALQEKSRYDDAFGVLAATGDKVTIKCEGTSSAVVSIKGTFTGKIRVYGSASDAVSTQGGRIGFLSGVGSVGSNVLVDNGVPWNKEFRFVTGGNFFTLEAEDWVSGSVEVNISVSQASSLVFINGPVHDAEEEAVRAGRAYLSGLSSISLTAAQELHFILSNPVASTTSIYLTERLFSAVANDSIEYKAYGNPTTPLALSGAILNRKVDGIASDATLTYEVAAAGAIVLNGAGGSSEPVPTDGTVRERKLLVIIPPGGSVGFTIRGAGNNTGQASRIWSTLQWYEEDSVI